MNPPGVQDSIDVFILASDYSYPSDHQGLKAVKSLKWTTLLPVLQASQITGTGLLLEFEGFSDSNKAGNPATATPDAVSVFSCDGSAGASVKGASVCH